MIVDIQIALSFVIVAFGIGVFFISSKSKVSCGRKLLEIAEHIEENFSNASNDKLHEWNKYSDFILQKFKNLNKRIKEEQEKRKESSHKH